MIYANLIHCDRHRKPTMRWYSNDQYTAQEISDLLGFIPYYLNEDDPRPASEQIAARFVGGWKPTIGFTMNSDLTMFYEDDPLLVPVALTRLREEMIVVYPHAWVAIVRKNDTFEVARCD
jgi:hypothetical protein